MSSLRAAARFELIRAGFAAGFSKKIMYFVGVSAGIVAVGGLALQGVDLRVGHGNTVHAREVEVGYTSIVASSGRVEMTRRWVSARAFGSACKTTFKLRDVWT